jgi:isoleucyl-tRNA synthetase
MIGMNDESKRDYKHTILLPKTDFPMQGQLAKREPEMLKRWFAEGLYEKVMAASKGREAFWFVDGPPYANGDIHIGHAVNKVLKDIVVKSARLDGKSAAFVPGWDCHGLPIELQVEKKHGKVGEKLDAKAFREKCREYAKEQIDRQREDFKRLGVLADWDHPYVTMDPKFEAEQLRVLARIVDNGHVVRGFKPVHWCLDCGSSLAEAEVEYADKQSNAIYVKFSNVDAAALASAFGVEADKVQGASFVIWTTTPWTLPANQAIAVNADFEYALAETPSGERLVLARERIDAIAVELKALLTVVATTGGKKLEGLKARHPFAGREVPVILGDHVTQDSGTGMVHTAPAHGADDYQVGLKYQLPVDNPVGADGKFIAGTPLVAGQHVRKADEPILADLRASGALLHEGKITHSYPHCWRHKTPLIFRATPQWFISMDANGLRQQALAEIERTRFIPDWGRERIREMVATRPDWCISRQRYWGVPMAVFIDKQTQALHPETASLLRSVADRVEEQGLETWFGSSAADWLGDKAAQYDKCTDTLDVWFDSGVVHQCMFKAMLPGELDATGIAPQADFYLEGSDQHRGWFQSSLLTSVAMLGRAPYRAVLTHGFTVDEQGRKQSKSLGNVVAPQEVFKKYGADVLRLWVSASDYSGEIAVYDKLLERIADAYRRIRNTARYLLGSLNEFDPARDAVAVDKLLPLDAWALSEAQKLQTELQTAYRDADFHLIYQKLHNYCVVDLGGLYLDILKDRLYTLPLNHHARRSAQTALFHLAEAMVRWIAPILSFTADEIWCLLPGDRSASVFSQTWYELPAIPASARTPAWDKLLSVRESVKKVLEELRVKGEIGSSLDATVALFADGEMLSALRSIGDEMRFWLITSEAKVATAADAPENAVEMKTGEGEGDVMWVVALPSRFDKCQRCWHHRPGVGTHEAHPTLCGRCIANVDGAGETRQFV